MMFEVKNNNLRSKIISFLKKKKIGTKNVPDAIKWHFAHYWKHAIKREQIKSIQSSRKKIESYIAIPILIKQKVSTYKEIGSYIKKLAG